MYSHLPLHDNLELPLCLSVQVGISEQSTFTFLVSNLSRFILEVNFELTGPKALQQHLVTKTQNAAIDAGKQLQSSLCFSPQCICNLKDVKLNIKVIGWCGFLQK